ncbi:MAG: hypothetical protein ACP5R5_05650 [Armatimonadota bacterium]
MRTFRVRFRLVSSLGTPFHADTVFGHICWAIRYLEGEKSLEEFLAAFDGVPPLLLSDGLPVIGDKCYVPYPALPARPQDFEATRESAGVPAEDRGALREFAGAWKALQKKPYIELGALIPRASPLRLADLARDCFALAICPGTMAERDLASCACEDWKLCPALGTGPGTTGCRAAYPEYRRAVTTHNVVNRWTMASVNLYTREDTFPSHELYLLARLDDTVMTARRLRACLDYICGSGYGPDKSTGCGAMKDLVVEEWSPPEVPSANAFLNLSSAYVPRQGELGRGYYNVHVKRGKLGGDYVLKHSPWKRPVLMTRAGSVLEGDPAVVHGTLVRKVHYELQNVVQYGYAYPLGVKLDAEAL